MVSVNRRLGQDKPGPTSHGGEGTNPRLEQQLAKNTWQGLTLHVAFGKWELLPVGKAEVDSVS